MICLQIFAGNVPFYELKGDAQVMFAILQGSKPKHPLNALPVQDEIWSLMECCWNKEPSKNLTATQSVQVLEPLADLSSAGSLPDWTKISQMQMFLRQPSPFVPSLKIAHAHL